LQRSNRIYQILAAIISVSCRWTLKHTAEVKHLVQYNWLCGGSVIGLSNVYQKRPACPAVLCRCDGPHQSVVSWPIASKVTVRMSVLLLHCSQVHQHKAGPGRRQDEAICTGEAFHSGWGRIPSQALGFGNPPPQKKNIAHSTFKFRHLPLRCI